MLQLSQERQRLFIKQNILEDLDPYQFGGGMISDVKKDSAEWAEIPQRFEAGTPNISGVVAFSSALDYLQNIDMENIFLHEQELTNYCLKRLNEIDGLSIIGPKDEKSRTGLVSFILKDIHTHDVAAILNTEGIAVRSGNHCAMPLHESLGISGSTRVSFYIYNTKDDIDKLIIGLKKVQEILL